jgi:hypothetical protein
MPVSLSGGILYLRVSPEGLRDTLANGLNYEVVAPLLLATCERPTYESANSASKITRAVTTKTQTCPIVTVLSFLSIPGFANSHRGTRRQAKPGSRQSRCLRIEVPSYLPQRSTRIPARFGAGEPFSVAISASFAATCFCMSAICSSSFSIALRCFSP